MTTPQEIFEEIKTIFPETTYRSFSRLCGMSESYYGSILAQNLAISTNALLHLAELLEHKKYLCADMTPRRINQIQMVQEKIAQEIAQRAHRIDSGNLKVRKMLIAALARISADRGTDSFPLMPTMLFR